MILSFIVGIGLVVGYLSYSNLDVPIESDQGSSQGDDLASFRSFSLDYSILDDQRYKSLEVFGENPVEIGITGERKNPFAPL